MTGQFAYSTPENAPLVPAFPVRYRNVEVVTACYRSDPRAVAASLARGLVAISDVVMVHLYDMPDVQHFGHVHECNVMVGARLDTGKGESGGFTVALFNDSDGALALGREVHGQPKKYGDVQIESRGDLVVGTLTRNGIDVVTVTTPYKSTPAAIAELAQHFDFAANLNLKLLREIDGELALAQITSRRLGDLVVHECWSGPCTVELRPNAQAPVWQLPVLEPLLAYHWRADFTLVPGTVLRDFQKEAPV